MYRCMDVCTLYKQVPYIRYVIQPPFVGVGIRIAIGGVRNIILARVIQGGEGRARGS
jgi:hypothetical protein